jgi:hypothetical protein
VGEGGREGEKTINGCLHAARAFIYGWAGLKKGQTIQTAKHSQRKSQCHYLCLRNGIPRDRWKKLMEHRPSFILPLRIGKFYCMKKNNETKNEKILALG